MTVALPGRWRMVTLLVLVAGAIAPAAEPATSTPLADALKPYVERGNLAGAVVLVANKDKVLAVETTGYADVEKKEAIKPDALFWIASQSKPITAAALMILVDEGKVKLEDPVSKYLPEFNNVWVATDKTKDHMSLKRPDRPIIVRDLLNHTSGMPFSSAPETPTLDGLPLKYAVLTYAMTPLNTEPGKKYAYSNAGINTAGRIIEVVSKQSYESFLDKRLFEPLGMTDTTFWPNESQVKRLAKAYRPGPGGKGLVTFSIDQLKYPLTNRENRFPMPAGGLFSTAADVGRFCQMMLNGGTLDGKKILSEEAVKEMSKRQTPASVPESYGLGFSVGGGSFGHGGALSTNMTIDTNRGMVYVYLIQHAGFPGDGGKAQEAFRKAADAQFPAKSK